MPHNICTAHYYAVGNIDYVDILPTTRSISRNADMRQCFMIITNDDSLEEEPERLEISGTAKSHFLEFNPHSAVIWIIDDESMYYYCRSIYR